MLCNPLSLIKNLSTFLSYVGTNLFIQRMLHPRHSPTLFVHLTRKHPETVCPVLLKDISTSLEVLSLRNWFKMLGEGL